MSAMFVASAPLLGRKSRSVIHGEVLPEWQVACLRKLAPAATALGSFLSLPWVERRPACFLPKSTFENVPGLKVDAGAVPRCFQAGAKTRSLPRDTNAAQDVPGKT
jgi:hypothetical protein